MANSQFVLLLVAVCASNTWAQWPTQGGFPGGQGGFPGSQGGFPGGPGGFPGGPGGFPGGPGGFPGGPGGFPGGQGMFPGQGFNPLFGNGQQGFPQQFQPPQILTCIGTNEAQDHLKITLRPEPSSFTSQNPAFQFGQPRELNRQDWRISAVYIPAASYGAISPSGTSSLVGQFFLALTRYGRTDGNCAGLGGILQNDDLINQGQQPRGQFSQFSNGMYGQTSYPAGFIQDPIVISQGGNVYSGVVRDLSEADLRGRGVAICLDYLCQRPTTTCCSVVKDSVPATEVVGAPTIGSYSGSALLSGSGAKAGTSTGGGNLFGGSTGQTSSSLF
ncbi:unnamed protein product [Lymnaea stagnalis]|uniref:Uncharacterized protein n=1 Tax=Lymnaea stagnalis TaxID=6523 RepID=A0AAV2HVL0_LYMST